MDEDQPSEDGGHDGGTLLDSDQYCEEDGRGLDTQLGARVIGSDQSSEDYSSTEISESESEEYRRGLDTQLSARVIDSDQSSEDYSSTESSGSESEEKDGWLWYCERCGYEEIMFKTDLLEMRDPSCRRCGESCKLVFRSWERGILCYTCCESAKLALTNPIGEWDEERRAFFGPEALKCLSAVGNSSQDQELLQKLGICQELRLSLLNLKSKEVPVGLTLCQSLVSLDMSCNELTSIPDGIFSLSHLESLNLSINKLTEIPSDIKALAELKDVNLSHNEISRDITSVCQCIKLRRLVIHDNQLVNIPVEVVNLIELEEIDLSLNKISDFDSLVTCAKLRKVLLDHNKLASIPAEVGKLSELEEIDLSFNQIRDFDPLVTCAKLRKVLLDHNKLESIPAEVGKLSELEEIDLSCNQIRDFDPLVTCAKLRKVSLRYNKLESIPAEVGKLSELEEIDLSDNEISDFDSLVTCAKLRKLSLRYRRLESIPAEVGKLSELKEVNLSRNEISAFESLVTCAKLRKLSLYDNKLESIPAEVGKLSELEEIDLSCNQIRDFDSLVSCAKLRVVDLCNNLINVIPPSIGNLKQLEHLKLSNYEVRRFAGLSNIFRDKTDDTRNDICSLPDEVCQLKKLRVLDLRNNSLHQLPMHIDQCESLQKLWLDGNPLTRPPMEVCKSGVKAIFQYFKDLRQSESRVRKQQVVFLGETGAGKTSLARTLVNNQSSLADPADRTRVLDQYVLKVSNDLQLQITDFGGHHVYELAHTFFLTSEVIASLVVDLSRYDDNNYVNFAGRWLGTLMAMSWKSTVIVVGTHSDCCAAEEIEGKKKGLLGRIKDQHHQMITDVERQQERIAKTINRYDGRTEFHGYVQYLKDIRKSKERCLESLRSNFNLIDDIFVTSSHSLHGIPEFKSQLLTVCDKKAATLPGLWLAIQDIMDEQSDEPCIMLEKFHEIVRRGFTVRELPTDDIQHTAAVLLSYQHQCGNYLWFENDDQLKGYVFHRPDFVVEFLKGIFHHNMDSQLDQSNQDFDFKHFTKESFKKAKNDFLKCGLISTHLLRCLVKRYVSDESLFDTLVHLLEKFSLCYPVREKGHGSILCFPWFLTNDKPDEMQMKWQKKPGEQQYQIEFHFSMQFPEAFFELAIVRVHQRFGPFLQDVVTWKSGVYFRKGYDKIRMSKVREDNDDILQLAVRGEQVTKSWPSLMKAYHVVVGLLLRKWPGASYDVFYVCPHCLCSEVADPTRYPAQDLHTFLSGEEFLPCDNSDEGMVKVDEVVPGPFSLPSEVELFEAQKGFDNICQQKVKCSSAEGGRIHGSSKIAGTSTSHAVSSSNPSLLGNRKSAFDNAEAGIIPPKIPVGVASTSTDPSTATAISQSTKELHYKLLNVVDDHLLDLDFGKLKHSCRVWIMPARLEGIKDTLQLLEQLEKQGVIEVGNYRKLIELLEEHNLINIKKEVEAMAEKIAKLKTNP